MREHPFGGTHACQQLIARPLDIGPEFLRCFAPLFVSDFPHSESVGPEQFPKAPLVDVHRAPSTSPKTRAARSWLSNLPTTLPAAPAPALALLPGVPGITRPPRHRAHGLGVSVIA